MSLFLTNIVGNYATNRQHQYNDLPLSDVLHTLFQPINPEFLDVILIVLNIITITFVIYKSVKQKTSMYIHKLCLTIGVLYLLRCLCIYVTYLPNSRICTFDETNNLITTVRKDFCGDLMFSGHTSQYTVGMLFLYEVYPRKYILFFGSISSVLYASLISISRLHYTIDVIIALLTSLFVYQNVKRVYPYYAMRCKPESQCMQLTDDNITDGNITDVNVTDGDITIINENQEVSERGRSQSA